eukprot:TRINITY_DN16014_c0_g4_i1.p1 TRINITY_DN16014_c0_g4~~TRINITY_DN16014_c0_g4_i1.p1  ORF type:complete len:316 (-),score=22.77 TRINITY_DN16014_c0_g4_i1:97-1044(-)
MVVINRLQYIRDRIAAGFLTKMVVTQLPGRLKVRFTVLSQKAFTVDAVLNAMIDILISRATSRYAVCWDHGHKHSNGDSVCDIYFKSDPENKDIPGYEGHEGYDEHVAPEGFHGPPPGLDGSSQGLEASEASQGADGHEGGFTVGSRGSQTGQRGFNVGSQCRRGSEDLQGDSEGFQGPEDCRGSRGYRDSGGYRHADGSAGCVRFQAPPGFDDSPARSVAPLKSCLKQAVPKERAGLTEQQKLIKQAVLADLEKELAGLDALTERPAEQRWNSTGDPGGHSGSVCLQGSDHRRGPEFCLAAEVSWIELLEIEQE